MKRRITPVTNPSPNRIVNENGSKNLLPPLSFLRTNVHDIGTFVHTDVGDGNVDIYSVSSDGQNVPFACVRDSSIPLAGKGVYICNDVRAGDVIGRYIGRVIVTKGRFGTATWEGSKRQTIGD